MLAVLLAGSGVAVLDAASPADAAVPRSSVVWGRSYHHKSYVLHQVPGRPGPLALHSYDGLNDFVVNANGDLSTSRQHRQHGRGPRWYPYCRAHSNGAGSYFYLQRDGNMIVKRRDRSTIVWKTGEYLKAGATTSPSPSPTAAPSGEIGPGATRDFGIQWNTGPDFQTAGVRVEVTSTGNTSGATTFTGHCWYYA